jgi:hypothetical protein
MDLLLLEIERKRGPNLVLVSTEQD